MRERESGPFSYSPISAIQPCQNNGDAAPQPTPRLLRHPKHGSRPPNLSFNRDNHHPYLLDSENLFRRPKVRAPSSFNLSNGSRVSQLAHRSSGGPNPTANKRVDKSPFRKRPVQIFREKEKEVFNLETISGYPASKGENWSKGGGWGSEKDNCKSSPYLVRTKTFISSPDFKHKDLQDFPRIDRDTGRPPRNKDAELEIIEGLDQ